MRKAPRLLARMPAICLRRRDDLGPVRPACRCSLDHGAHVRHGRQEDPQPGSAAAQNLQRLAERFDEPADFALARAGKQQQRPDCVARWDRPLSLRGSRCEDAGLVRQPVADEGAGRTVEALELGRLERQQAKHVIDMRTHRLCAAGAPCPHARADIVDDRDRGRCRAHLARDAQAELRAVDGDQAIRPGGDDGARRLADPPDQARQVADDRADTHQGDLGRIEQALKPLPLQMTSADADDLDRPPAHRTQRADQVGAEQVAGFLAGDDGDAQRLCAVAHAPSPDRPTTKIPAASALVHTAS